MPGLIDMHWHAMLVRPTPAAVMTDDIGYTTLVAGVGGDRYADARIHHRARHGWTHFRS